MLFTDITGVVGVVCAAKVVPTGVEPITSVPVGELTAPQPLAAVYPVLFTDITGVVGVVKVVPTGVVGVVGAAKIVPTGVGPVASVPLGELTAPQPLAAVYPVPFTDITGVVGVAKMVLIDEGKGEG